MTKSSFYDEFLIYVLQAKARAAQEDCKLEDVLSIDRTTLWRWENKLNSRPPRADLILKCIQYALKEENFAKILDKVQETALIERVLINAYGVSEVYRPHSDKKTPADTHHLKDQHDFTLYYVCGTKRGATRAELIRLIGFNIAKTSGLASDDLDEDCLLALGKVADKKIDRLIELNILFKASNGHIKRTHTDLPCEVEKGLERQLYLLQANIKPENWGHSDNGLFSYQESLLPEDAKTIHQLTCQFIREVKTKMDQLRSDDPRAIPYFMFQCFERLTPSTTSTGVQ